MAEINNTPETPIAAAAGDEAPATPAALVKPVVVPVADIPVGDVTGAFNALTGSYDVLLLNTPWHRFSPAELAELPVGAIAGDNSTLFMWCDSATAGITTKVMRKWGFTFHSVASILNIAAPPAPLEPVEPAALEPEDEATESGAQTDMEVDGSDRAKAPRTPRAPRAPRIKSIHPPAWWSAVAEGAATRACTEQLWVGVKGAGAALCPKAKLAPFQVIDTADFPKKASKARKASATCPPEWYCTRPSELNFFETVLSQYGPSAKAIELFGDSIRNKVDAFGPGIPSMFVPALSGTDGDVGVIKGALEGLGKVTVRSVCAKLHKVLHSSDKSAPEEKVVQDFIASIGDDKWAAKDKSTVTIISNVADSFLAAYLQRKKKAKRARDAASGERPRHGIVCPGPVSKDLLEFFGEPDGTLVASTDVVKRINEYIKSQNPKDGKFFKLDEKLKKLLGDIEKSNYFDLHALLSPHFLKVKKSGAAAPEAKKARVE
ncbi:hypothetical protein JKP88DRAFT_285828 [Tribonema minus]|uniref:SWIB domain-containing protein n=1 Tax=Tribonema minus TaxID=303371 RepID=A0A836CLG3_9STRA|nr:hypothetical protein JKP88DRAFT_285828 [Tribonema minus]